MAIDFGTLRLISTLNELAEMLKYGALPFERASKQSDFRGIVYDETTKEDKQDDEKRSFEIYKIVNRIRDDAGKLKLIHYEPPFVPYTITFCRRVEDNFQYLSVNFEDCIESLTIEPGCWYID